MNNPNFPDELITRLTGVDPDTICTCCGKTARQVAKEPAVATGINHTEYCYSRSFHTYSDTKQLCTTCHREFELKSLFDMMDKRDKLRNKVINYQI